MSTASELAFELERLGMLERAAIAHSHIGSQAPGLVLAALADFLSAAQWVELAQARGFGDMMREHAIGLALEVMTYAAQDSDTPDLSTIEAVAGIRHTFSAHNPNLIEREESMPPGLQSALEDAQRLDEAAGTASTTVLASTAFNLVWATHLISPLTPEEAASQQEWVELLDGYVDLDDELDSTSEVREALDELYELLMDGEVGTLAIEERLVDATELGWQGDVSHLLSGVDEALAQCHLKQRTFRLVLDWAGNHEAPIVHVLCELEALHPAVRRHSTQLRLLFRSQGRLVAAESFHVSPSDWVAGTDLAVIDSTPGLIDLEGDAGPLTSVEVAATEPEPPGSSDYLFILRLPAELEKLLEAAGIRHVHELTVSRLAEVPGLSLAEQRRIREDLDFKGWTPEEPSGSSDSSGDIW